MTAAYAAQVGLVDQVVPTRGTLQAGKDLTNKINAMGHSLWREQKIGDGLAPIIHSTTGMGQTRKRRAVSARRPS